MAEIQVAPQINVNGVYEDLFIQTKSELVINSDGSNSQQHVDNHAIHVTSCSHTKIGIEHRLYDNNYKTITGSNITVTDAANTNCHKFIINGLTVESGTGIKSPDNPYSISGTSNFAINVNSQITNKVLSKPIYNIDTVKDTTDIVNGIRTNSVGIKNFVGIESWSMYSTVENATSVCFYNALFTNRLATSIGLCNRFIYNSNILNPTVTSEGYWLSDVQNNATTGYIRINKSRLTGWNDSLSDTDKINLFKTWVSSNNINFIYSLLTQTIELISTIDILTSSVSTNITIDKSTFIVSYFTSVPNFNVIDFKASADYNTNDTFRINGSLISVKMSNSNVLFNNAFKNGGHVMGKIDGLNLLLDITDGGNSDTVDGKHAIDFVPKVIGCTGSCDGYFQTGIYQGIFTNIPSGLPDGKGTLVVHSYGQTDVNAGFTQQEFITAQNSIKYIRVANNGTFSTWQAQYSALNIGTATVLNSDMVDGLHASDLGGMFIGTTAPTQLTKGWIDTANGGVLKYYNGTTWVAAKAVWG